MHLSGQLLRLRIPDRGPIRAGQPGRAASGDTATDPSLDRPVPLDSHPVELVPGQIWIRHGRIERVAWGETSQDADLGGDDCVIMPGLVDAHLHLPQFDVIGAHGTTLLRWLNESVFPAESLWSAPEYAAAMTERVIRQLHGVGTTAIAAYATVHHQGTMAALRTAQRMGVKGVIGQVLMDREAPEAWLENSDRQIETASATLDAFPPGSPLSAAVTPRFAVACSMDLLRRAGALAKQTRAIVQTHLAETVAECDLVSQRFDGLDYAGVYDQAGLLHSRSILGHGIHLDENQRRRLADRGAHIAHCPTANSFLRSGVMNRETLIESGISVGLGSDIGAGYERSMVRVARAMIEAAASIGQRFPTAAQAWWQITHGNARLIGMPPGERLSPGRPADLIIVRPDDDWHSRLADPLAGLMFGWDDRWIRQTIVDGRIVYPSR
ncbi:amidohydrolase family protein [Crateriforma spongiae]|uniref:amidohydrolase family protein n=1 Tax=Crateriforma spongiae TaxID=2724528 RepID=UPI001447F8FB|nr:amidohydrolase family protein [Crateriforma spongiae]